MKKYQVVIQFPEPYFESLEAIVEFEQKLTCSLPSTHDVDGYDAGMGTVNFFVYSNAPQAVLRNFRKYLGTNKVEKKVRIAFREVDGETFTNLWPKRDDREFDYSY